MKKIGIIGAMEVEVEALKKDMTLKEVVKKAGMEFYDGTLKGMPVIVVRSGICKVNAAVCTQILIDRFGADGILNTGVGGSLNADINIGDIVLSTDVVHHDVNATEFGYAPGQIPQMKEFSFRAEKTLIDLAESASKRVNPEIGVWRGRVCSGDQFVSSDDRKEALSREFHGFCTEMEGAGIAQTAYLNGVPFLIVRAISDKADHSAAMDYEAFEKEAAGHSVRLVEALMADLAG